MIIPQKLAPPIRVLTISLPIRGGTEIQQLEVRWSGGLVVCLGTLYNEVVVWWSGGLVVCLGTLYSEVVVWWAGGLVVWWSGG